MESLDTAVPNRIQTALLRGYEVRLFTRAEKRRLELKRMVDVIEEHQPVTAAAIARHLGKSDGRGISANLVDLRRRGWVASETSRIAGRMLWWPAGRRRS